jgi:hypothetical protein
VEEGVPHEPIDYYVSRLPSGKFLQGEKSSRKKKQVDRVCAGAEKIKHYMYSAVKGVDVIYKGFLWSRCEDLNLRKMVQVNSRPAETTL